MLATWPSPKLGPPKSPRCAARRGAPRKPAPVANFSAAQLSTADFVPPPKIPGEAVAKRSTHHRDRAVNGRDERLHFLYTAATKPKLRRTLPGAACWPFTTHAGETR